MMTANMPTIELPMRTITASAMLLAALFSLGATIAPQIYTSDRVTITNLEGDMSYDLRGTWGIFTKDVEIRLTEYGVVVSQTEGLATEDCDATAWDDGQIESKCADSKNHKCKTRKAFAVFGISFNVAAVALIATSQPAMYCLACTIGTAFSYMVVFAVSASLFNNGWSKDGADSACGIAKGHMFNGTDVGEAMSLGPSFVLYILAWLLALLSTGIIVFNNKGNMVAPL